MLSFTSRARSVFGHGSAFRQYSFCCPRRPPGTCGCYCQPFVPGGGYRIVPPADCRPSDIPPNPCVPRFHHGHDTYKKYKYLSLFVGFPFILSQLYIVMINHCEEPKGDCRDYEYMRMRAGKKYPWGDGVKTFFHNEHVNHLPGECTPPPLDCD